MSSSHTADSGHETQQDADAGKTDERQWQINASGDSLSATDTDTTDGTYSDHDSYYNHGTQNDHLWSSDKTTRDSHTSSGAQQDSGTFSARSFTGTGTLSFTITDSGQHGTFASHDSDDATTHGSSQTSGSHNSHGTQQGETSHSNTHHSNYTIDDQNFDKKVTGSSSSTQVDDDDSTTGSYADTFQSGAGESGKSNFDNSIGYGSNSGSYAHSSNTDSSGSYTLLSSSSADTGGQIHSAHTDTNQYTNAASTTRRTANGSSSNNSAYSSHSHGSNHWDNHATDETTTGFTRSGTATTGTENGHSVNTDTGTTKAFESFDNSESSGRHGARWMQSVSSFTSHDTTSGYETGNEHYSITDSGSGPVDSEVDGHYSTNGGSTTVTHPGFPNIGPETTTVTTNATASASSSGWSWTGNTITHWSGKIWQAGSLGNPSSSHSASITPASSSYPVEGSVPVPVPGGWDQTGSLGAPPTFGGPIGPSAGSGYVALAGAPAGLGAGNTHVDSTLVNHTPEYQKPVDTPVDMADQDAGVFDAGPGTPQAQGHDLANGTTAPQEFTKNNDPAGLLADDTSEQKQQQEQDADDGGGSTPDAQGQMHPDGDGGNSSGGGVALPGNQTSGAPSNVGAGGTDQPVQLDPAVFAHRESVAYADKLFRAGKAIMAAEPPETWVSEAQTLITNAEAGGVAVPSNLKNVFISWMTAEQQATLDPLGMKAAAEAPNDYDAMQYQEELSRLGRAIIKSEPPEKWVSEAEASLDRIWSRSGISPGDLNDTFLSWIATEQQYALEAAAGGTSDFTADEAAIGARQRAEFGAGAYADKLANPPPPLTEEQKLASYREDQIIASWGQAFARAQAMEKTYEIVPGVAEGFAARAAQAKNDPLGYVAELVGGIGNLLAHPIDSIVNPLLEAQGQTPREAGQALGSAAFDNLVLSVAFKGVFEVGKVTLGPYAEKWAGPLPRLELPAEEKPPAAPSNVLKPGEVSVVPRTGPKGVDPLHHNANVLVVDAEGNVQLHTRIVSGNMTPAEKALGFPKNTLASHTEARALKQVPLEAGETITITGQRPPCPTCKGAMNRAVEENGVKIIYRWRENGQTQYWEAGNN